jgi:3-hydroxyacyl-CoA dehydrogenase / enoyl-CoA hydratase / 3-hydroxybutyryl-CoA epimerase
MRDTIHWEEAGDGVVCLVLDDPDQSANTMNDAYTASMTAAIARLEAERDAIAGVVITSAKKTFFAGGDLNQLRAVTPEAASEFAAWVRENKDLLRRLETLRLPVVAAINGAALGGGLELALACHRRICVSDPKLQLGLPEVRLGLLPGAGGVVRTVRMLGVLDALDQVLLEGRRMAPAEALKIGLVDELVESADDLLPAARRWISANPGACQPWDAGGTILGGTPSSPGLAAKLPALPARLRKQLKGAPAPAKHNIVAAAVEGAQVDFDTALEIEGRYFVDLATGQVAKSMIQAFFFDQRRVDRGRVHPRPDELDTPRKVVVIGAGMMGAAITYVFAKAGIDVVVKDVSLEVAERGKRHSEKLVAKEVARGRISQERGEALLARITPTADPRDAAGAGVVVEAVFEDPTLKREVLSELEPHLADDALLGSNTSTLPISELADGVSRPADFIGLHFFSPVDKMPLLEIIRGEQTTDGTLQRALGLARLIKKTPIVVNDSRGFFTSRVIRTFINEGIAMLAEGIPAPSIEQASAQAGYPAPVLQLSDELNLELMDKIDREHEAAARAAGRAREPHPFEPTLARMIELGRTGRLAGAGFYDYEDGVRVGLWKGLREVFPPVADPAGIPFEDLKERMLFAEAIEAVRCLDEGVVESVADANIGSLLGIGFPGWTGGVLQYINGYAGGPAGFAHRAQQLAATYGARFEPPASLLELARRGGAYLDEQPATVA